MFVKILGFADVIIGLILFFGMDAGFPAKLILFIGMMLLMKSFLGMLQDFASWIDFICALVFLISSLFLLPWIIYLICGILIIQKGFMSFL